MSNYASIEYLGDGVTDTFAFGFPYMEDSDIVVSVDGLVVGRTLVSSPAQAVVLAVVPLAGTKVLVERQTNIVSSEADFEVGSTVRPADLDTLATQTLYVNQETRDIAGGAVTVAGEAATDSAQAVLDAAEAIATANGAVTVANGAVTTANGAVTTANGALVAANNAVTAAGLATTAAADATLAATAASADAALASAAAADATQEAIDAQDAANLATTTANTALTTANTALTQAGSAQTAAADAAQDASDASDAALVAQGAATTAQAAASAAQTAVGAHIGVGGVAQHPVSTVGTAGFLPALPVSTTLWLRSDGAWGTPTGSGDMQASTYDPNGVAGNAFDSANHVYTGMTSVKEALDDIIKNRVLTQTSWINAPLLSVNADNTKFDISAGLGVHVDWSNTAAPVYTLIVFAGATAVPVTDLTTSYASGIRVSSTGTILQQGGTTSPLQLRTGLYVGDVLHNNRTNLNGVQNKPLIQWDSIAGLRDLALAVGTITLSGNVYSANGTNLVLKKTGGSYFRAGVNYDVDPQNPNVISNPDNTPITSFLRGYRNGTGGWIYDTQTQVTPGVYDDGDGTVATVGTNQFTIQRLYNFPKSNLTVLVLGQTIYSSLANAVTGLRDSVVIDGDLRDAAFRGALIVRGNTTDLSNTSTAVFYQADKFGSSANIGGGVSTNDHELLDGLLGGAAGEHYHLSAQEYQVLTSGTVLATLSPSSWVGSTYTLNFTSVHDTNEVDFGAPCPTTAGNRTDLNAAGLWVSDVTGTSVTITADTVPTTSVIVALKGVTV